MSARSHNHSLPPCLGFMVLAAVLAATVPAASIPAAAGTMDYSEAQRIAVQSGGRLKPLDTYARETAREITGRERFAGMSPLDLLFTVAFKGDSILETQMFKIGFRPFKERVGLDMQRQRFSYRELIENQTLMRLVDQVREKQHSGADLDRLEREVSTVYGRLVQMSMIMNGEEPRLVPTPGGARAEWLSAAQVASAPAIGGGIAGPWEAMRSAFVAGDAAQFKQASGELRAGLRRTGGGDYPSEDRLNLELTYNRTRPQLVAQFPYLLAALGFFLGFAIRRRWLYVLSCLLLFGGFAVQTYGLALRTILTGRAPVGNLYEALIFIGWGVVGLAMFLELLTRTRINGAVAGIAGFVVLVLAHYLPLDSAINPLVAVLNATWLQYHVTTILFGDSALTLAAAVAHFIMFAMIVAPRRANIRRTALTLMYRSIQVGVLCLAAGIIFGAIWANASWGRYWGWDPKETWALITLIGFLVVLHGRQAGWLRERGQVLLTVVGLQLLVFTVYGVNYFLVGLHSYAGGDASVQLPPILMGYLVFEAIVVGAYLLACRKAEGIPAAAVPADRRV